MWYAPAENLADELCHQIVRKAAETGARLVCIDGLNGIQSGLIFEERLPLIVNALNRRLRSLGVTLLYTMEHRHLFLPDSIGSDDMTMMMDNLLVLHYGAGEKGLYRKVAILKVRDSIFHSPSEEFHITHSGVQFGPPPPSNLSPLGAIPSSEDESGRDQEGH
jgi:hypothetical protein